jgi:hypothetical protein
VLKARVFMQVEAHAFMCGNRSVPKQRASALGVFRVEAHAFRRGK